MPFGLIKDGSKTIEARLYDDKRKGISVGDEIEFSLMTDEDRKIRTKVVDLSPHKTFPELFDTFPPARFGAENKTDLMSIYSYYTKEEEAEYGVLGIILELIA